MIMVKGFFISLYVLIYLWLWPEPSVNAAICQNICIETIIQMQWMMSLKVGCGGGTQIFLIIHSVYQMVIIAKFVIIHPICGPDFNLHHHLRIFTPK